MEAGGSCGGWYAVRSASEGWGEEGVLGALLLAERKPTERRRAEKPRREVMVGCSAAGDAGARTLGERKEEVREGRAEVLGESGGRRMWASEGLRTWAAGGTTGEGGTGTAGWSRMSAGTRGVEDDLLHGRRGKHGRDDGREEEKCRRAEALPISLHNHPPDPIDRPATPPGLPLTRPPQSQPSRPPVRPPDRPHTVATQPASLDGVHPHPPLGRGWWRERGRTRVFLGRHMVRLSASRQRPTGTAPPRPGLLDHRRARHAPMRPSNPCVPARHIPCNPPRHHHVRSFAASFSTVLNSP
ncbi:hypothetical protein FA95DRAFT_501647 [Auriscalpium vulgare]|uniref:Uncharacterized protein n=1 Tax=Auriscalpium vulgare TaxID=40419 RepID=A0ACB8S4X4_9AGAM|nr:hypothetical protein FA95DRAFT_501647 [Auriscalpium vulgare]